MWLAARRKVITATDLIDLKSGFTKLTEDQKERIRKKLPDTTDYLSMRVRYEVDPSLIGGMVIKLKDKVVDSSLKTKLGHMKNSLLTGA